MRRHRKAMQKINKALVEGVGGMQFTAQAPPGIGRLIRIPFYLETAQGAGYDALLGQAAAAIPGAGGTGSTTHPSILVQPPGVAGATATTIIMQTPQISWAILRVVGFECAINEVVLPSASAMEVCFADLQIGGGANLFVHEDFAPSRIYLAGQDSFAGLRDYPILRSPNQAEVSVQAVGDAGSDALNFSASLVCEILQDDNYGAHVPGPYARPGALVRQGGSFVS